MTTFIDSIHLLRITRTGKIFRYQNYKNCYMQVTGFTAFRRHMHITERVKQVWVNEKA
jgi:hypothetical protein